MESPTSLLAAATHSARTPPRVPRPRRPRRGVTIAGLIAAFVAAAAPAADAETRSLKLLSDGPFRTDPALPAGFLYESPDGARVFFQTDEALEGSDTDATLDAYMRTSAGVLVHLTDNPFAADAPIDAYLDYISADGTRAFFDSQEKLASTDTDDVAFDAYERTPAGALVHHSDSPSADVRIVVRRRGARARTLALADRPAGPNGARLRMRARGRYRVTITATDAAGNRSLPRRVALRIVRRPR